MGKKGKGNKLAKMSEEERARYLQLRADIEEEARRRKIQLISLYMKNKLKREDVFCRLNMAKINQEWRTILRHVKCEELQQEIMELDKCSREALERKDQTIKRLLNNLQIAEDMYGTQQQAHMEIIDKLITCHQHRLAYLKEMHRYNKMKLLSEYGIDSTAFKQQSDKVKEKLECIIYQLEKKYEEEIKSKFEDHLKQLDDNKSTMQFELETISRKGEIKLENLWQQYQDVLSHYVKRTENFYTEYMDLKQNNEEDTKIVQDYKYEIEKSSKQLLYLKSNAAGLEEKHHAKFNHMLKLKNDLHERHCKLKSEVTKQTAADAQKVNLLSVLSHKTVKYLKDIVRKGETLVQMCTVCNRFVSEHEKMFPYGLPPISKQMFQNDEMDITNLQTDLMETNQQPLCQAQRMNKLWHRINHAAIDVVSLRQKKKSLEIENKRLKLNIQDALIEMNIQSGSNTHVNYFVKQRPQTMQMDQIKQISINKLSATAVKQKTNSSHRRRPKSSF